ncbi:hypothetical protein [Emticicia fontis]
MKNLLLALAINFIIISCKDNNICCVIIDTSATISVIEKNTGADLFNPNSKNYIDAKSLALEFSTNPGKKFIVKGIDRSQPVFYQSDGIYYLRIFPTTYEALTNEHTVTIHWNDKDSDKVKFQIVQHKNGAYTDKLFLNDSLIWTHPNEKIVTIYK